MAQIKSLRPGLDTIELPSLGEMLEGEAVHYQFAKTFNELEDVTAFIIHSSGTTGGISKLACRKNDINHPIDNRHAQTRLSHPRIPRRHGKQRQSPNARR